MDTDTSYVTDTGNDSVNDTVNDTINDTINQIINESSRYETEQLDETEKLEETEAADAKQSITTKTSIIPQKKQPDQVNRIYKMDTCDDLANDPINNTINDIINETVHENRQMEETEMADVKNSITTKASSISQKKQPDQLCSCPLHCDMKISKEWREKIYKQFGDLGDHSLQNQYIQRHIKIKSIAKRLWEDEIIDKKIQRRVTCKYLIPLTGSVKESYSYAKTLNYESAKFALDTNIQENSKKVNFAANTPNVNGASTLDVPNQLQPSDIEMKESPQCNGTVNGVESDSTNSMELDQPAEKNDPESSPVIQEHPLVNGMKLETVTQNGTTIKENGSVSSMELDSATETKTLANGPTTHESSSISGSEPAICTQIETNATKMNGTISRVKQDTIENGSSTISDVNSPSSFNDNESVNTADESNTSELDSTPCSGVKYVDVCQKAFMNMYGITEKRIRWQREKLILRSRYLAEKQRKELEEMDRTLSLARSLGAGCQPLFAFLEKSEYKQLSEQLLVAIEDDVMLVNNFFHNQLWKPEDIMNKSMHLSTSLDSCETDCDLTLN